MAYSRTNWVQEETQLNATNMNNIEEGIAEAFQGIEDAEEATATVAAKIAGVTKTEIDLLAGKTSSNLRKITAGTTDLTPGTSALATDTFYFMYE